MPDGLFRQPTDVAWDSQATLHHDGYHSRRGTYTPRRWVNSWGERGTGPWQFRCPTPLRVDTRSVYVGDRRTGASLFDARQVPAGCSHRRAPAARVRAVNVTTLRRGTAAPSASPIQSASPRYAPGDVRGRKPFPGCSSNRARLHGAWRHRPTLAAAETVPGVIAGVPSRTRLHG